jgi:ribose transport system permease protein
LGGKLKERLKTFTRNADVGLGLAAIIMFVILSVASTSFFTEYNIYTIARNMALYAFVGLSQAVVLVIGDMNLSAGAIGGLATITAGYLMDIHGMPSWLGVLAALAVGIGCGLLNGVISSKFGINAFVVTLATSFVFTGINFGFTMGNSFTNIPDSFTIVGKGSLFGVIPYLFLFMIAVLLILYFFYSRTVLGRRLLAIGQNIDAARFSGINDRNLKVLGHTMSGFVASLAAVLFISRMGSAQPAAGQEWLIISFAVAIIGGTALSGGVISPLGIFIGAAILVMIKNGLVLLKTNVYWEQTFLGLLILLAVGIDTLRTYFNRRQLMT